MKINNIERQPSVKIEGLQQKNVKITLIVIGVLGTITQSLENTCAP